MCVLGFVACKKSKTLIVEDAINADKKEMVQNATWYESTVVLNNYLDEECDGSVEEITNVFQVADSVNSEVTLFVHTAKKTDKIVKQGFWIGDVPMDSIKLTFKEAFDTLMATNLPKPHSKYCVLRKQLGPNPSNPQYIFGNVLSQVYVDAMTGSVSDKNPVFPEEE